MIDEREKQVLAALDALGIEYERLGHPPAASMEECAAIGALMGADHCKNLFLTNKRGTEFHLVLIGSEKRFRTSVVSKLLGSTRLSFASPEQLHARLGLTEGSISVAGLLNDTERRVHVAIDRDILSKEHMLIHPNINTASLRVRTADVRRFLDSLGYDWREIDIAGAENGGDPDL
ncbi:MAG: prolyl-tRNA synthetase associated domain-containing protein [Clostridia bacterium]|nr:prolyl-tRNA synthetase associated domain-containing protein [Clostridia bacterium]